MDGFQPRSADGDVGGDEDWVEGDDEIVTVGGPIPNVVHAEALDASTLFVRFDDGVEGRVRFEPTYLNGVWAKLRDPAYFHRVGIAYGAVSWPNEEPDMAPDRMHDELIARGGEWVLN